MFPTTGSTITAAIESLFSSNRRSTPGRSLYAAVSVSCATALVTPELSGTPVKQISVEAAQPKLDCKVLESLPGKTIILGTLDLGTNEVETAAIVAERIRRALPYVKAENLVIAPDCGMKYLPRDVAFGKLKAMVDGAAIVRKELA